MRGEEFIMDNDNYHELCEDIAHSGNKSDSRKSNKPIMEKRRRARINNCLNELKGILLDAMRKDPARHSKLEKSDILELTVRHLQNIQRNQLAVAMATGEQIIVNRTLGQYLPQYLTFYTDPTVLYRFKNGFSECASEVSRYLSKLEGADEGMKNRVAMHLSSCVSGLKQIGPSTGSSAGGYGGGRFTGGVAEVSFGPFNSPPSGGTLVPPSNLTPPEDLNNNKDIVVIHRPTPISAFSNVIASKPPSPSPPTIQPRSEDPVDYSVRQVKVVKVEPIIMSSNSHQTPSKDAMWRPW